ncbi:unnamed protein product, partial [Mesorhabditis belari]|uniref:N-acetylgalactosaminide beta-1,3-galactosyltransferase n=1 Tax=Mesorhabditis belari TaxID=2138241 RepID=A0AAF3FFX8_9BILA
MGIEKGKEERVFAESEWPRRLGGGGCMPRCDFRFWAGVLIGILLTLLYTEHRIANYVRVFDQLKHEKEEKGANNKPDLEQRPNFPDAQHLEDDMDDEHQIDFSGQKSKNEEPHLHEDHGLLHSHEQNNVTDVLFDRVQVLCWIMTHPTTKNIKKVTAVNETWTKRCNKVIYFNTYNNLSVETVELNFTEGRNYLWDKTKRVLVYLHKTYGTKYNWFFKADDDTFVVMENLRYLLSGHDPNEPHYIGCGFKLHKYFYNSGGAGYVLSRKALELFVTEALPKKECPQGAGGPEDFHLGKCLNSIGVNVTDTRDLTGKLRFLPLSAVSHFIDHLPSWLEKYLPYEYHHKAACCSNLVVTFHYITPDMMYLLEFFTYHLSIFGRPAPYTVQNIGTTDEIFERIRQSSIDFTNKD